MDYKKKYLKYKLKYLNKVKNQLRGGEHHTKQGQIIWQIPKKRMSLIFTENPTSSWLLMPLIAAALSNREKGEGVFFPEFFATAFENSITSPYVDTPSEIKSQISTIDNLVQYIRIRCNSHGISTWKDIVDGKTFEGRNFKVDAFFPEGFHMPPDQQEFLVDNINLGSLITTFIANILNIYITEEGSINPDYTKEVIRLIYNDDTPSTVESSSSEV